MNVRANERPRRLARLALSLSAVALMLAACVNASDPASSGDGAEEPAVNSDAAGTDSGAPSKLVVAIPAEPDNLDVMKATSSVLRLWVGRNVAETLAFWDIDNDVFTPLLATGWEQVQDDQWEITLRDGVTFHDGSDMTAQDAAASINYGIAEDSSLYQTFYPTILSAEATGDLTMVVTTDGLDPVFERRLPFLSVVPEEELSATSLASTLTGTGPYELASWTRGRDIILERNEDYWGESAPFDSVTFMVRPEASVRADAVRTGEAHLAFSISAEHADDAPQLLQVPGGEVAGFYLNTVGQTEGGSVLEDERVRRAVNHAIDRQAIADSIFGGFARLPQGQYNIQEATGTDPTLSDYEYDPEKARELISEAGVDGATLDMLVVTDLWQKAEEFAQATAGYLNEVGLEVKMTSTGVEEWRNQYGANAAGDDAPYELFMMYHDNEFFDSTMKTFSTIQSSAQGGGHAMIADARIDELIAKAATTVDSAERLALSQEVWRTIHEQAYMLPIVIPEVIYSADERLDWAPRADGMLYLENVGWRS